MNLDIVLRAIHSIDAETSKHDDFISRAEHTIDRLAPDEGNDRGILDCLLAHYCDKSRPRQEDLAIQRSRYISDNYEALRALDTNQIVVYPDGVRLRITVSVWGEDGENMFVNTEDV